MRRHPWLDYFQPTEGPGSGVYGSTDGGRTWVAAGRAGWPAGDLGRIALAVAPGSAGLKVWAAVSGKGLFSSSDGGATWTLANGDGSLANSYMANLSVDPRDPATLWAMGRGLRRSTDGGKSFAIAKGAPGGDDYHILWIDPVESRRMIVGADQGAVITLNGGASWSSWYNQPTGQFYRLAADQRFPYWIYSGQQDSGTVGIASRSDYGQLTFRDWHPVGGDERDGDIPDPANPDIVYGAGLGGRLSKWDARTGEVQNVSPWPIPSYAARPDDRALPLQLDHSGGNFAPAAACDLPGRAGALPLARWRRVVEHGESRPLGGGSRNGRLRRRRAGHARHRLRIRGYLRHRALAGRRRPGLGRHRQRAGAAHPGRRHELAGRHAAGPGRLEQGEHRRRLRQRSQPRPTSPRTVTVSTRCVRSPSAPTTSAPPGPTSPAACRRTSGSARCGRTPKRAGLLYAGTNRGVYVSFDDGERWQSLQLNLPTTGINDLLVAGERI